MRWKRMRRAIARLENPELFSFPNDIIEIPVRNNPTPASQLEIAD